MALHNPIAAAAFEQRLLDNASESMYKKRTFCLIRIKEIATHFFMYDDCLQLCELNSEKLSERNCMMPIADHTAQVAIAVISLCNTWQYQAQWNQQ